MSKVVCMVTAAFGIVSLVILGSGLAVLFTAGGRTVPACYKHSMSTEHYGSKCYLSGMGCVCANATATPCCCVGLGFSSTCLQAPPGPGDNPQLIAGIAITSIGGVAVFMVAVFAVVSLLRK